MPLPEKGYFSLEELAVRWGLPIKDIWDYALEGVFPLYVWLGKVQVEIYQYEETFRSPLKRKCFNDYVAVQTIDLHEIFRIGNCPISTYRLVGDDEKCPTYIDIIEREQAYIIKLRDLVISRPERDKVEKAYDLVFDEVAPPVAAKYNAISFPGRPSVMHLIIQHMKQRSLEHTLCPVLRQEAQYLHGWAKQNIADAQVPKPRSIENGIRLQFNALNENAPFKIRKTAAH